MAKIWFGGSENPLPGEARHSTWELIQAQMKTLSYLVIKSGNSITVGTIDMISGTGH